MQSPGFISGNVILIDKPLHWTSFAVVNKLRWAITHSHFYETEWQLWQQEHGVKQINNKQHKPTKHRLKIGHAGTLDPLATGLLIICTGKKTKEIDTFQGQEKEYTGTLCLGATTPCFDLEMQPDTHYPTQHITQQLIISTAQTFVGNIWQTPPIHSAIKQDGKRLYHIARQGKDIEIIPKQITISQFEITDVNMPYVNFRVVCSKGTYIRSLANDFGKALNSGAHLTQLCRSRIGNFMLTEALSIETYVKTLVNIDTNVKAAQE